MFSTENEFITTGMFSMMKKAFSNQKYVLYQAFDCQTKVFNVELKTVVRQTIVGFIVNTFSQKTSFSLSNVFYSLDTFSQELMSSLKIVLFMKNLTVTSMML